MNSILRLTLAASAAMFAIGCTKKAEEAAVEPEAEAETLVADAAPIGSANVTVTLTNGAPAFGEVAVGFCAGGGCAGGINLLAAGNVDLSGFPPGDVTVNVTLDSSMTGAGYSLPSDPWQAVAIVVIPPGTVTAPIPVFGQANWPAEFDAPSVSASTVTFIDKEDDQNAYEYSIALVAPGGATLVMDPKIQNGTGGGNK